MWPTWPWCIEAWNGVNAPPLSETNTLYDEMLVAPAPGDPLHRTVKLVLVVVAGNGLTVLVGGAGAWVTMVKPLTSTVVTCWRPLASTISAETRMSRGPVWVVSEVMALSV